MRNRLMLDGAVVDPAQNEPAVAQAVDAIEQLVEAIASLLELAAAEGVTAAADADLDLASGMEAGRCVRHVAPLSA